MAKVCTEPSTGAAAAAGSAAATAGPLADVLSSASLSIKLAAAVAAPAGLSCAVLQLRHSPSVLWCHKLSSQNSAVSVQVASLAACAAAVVLKIGSEWPVPETGTGTDQVLAWAASPADQVLAWAASPADAAAP